ncbi:UvrD/REP helicase (plasmid) [Thioalkalivibrio sp. K90mix]|uniref:ATP-dependent helicase n=1 Tax=Thioalkalivibrio sp. (strain K90mix) TaxID=396595 RepID=UPI000195A8C3|nr:UvrD-helicase domain-containing protein [Thioalkalivibrio sp. K90mix]ADC73332.1 UvrD/REP helicase [Thioalkalivibrio sp. K90mix]
MTNAIRLEELNDNQREAVTSDGHCLVSACPGSGKTRVLITRARRLLDQDPKHRVAAVTFTQASAIEMTQRMSAEGLPPRELQRFQAGTFHSLALSQATQARKAKASQILATGEWISILRNAIDQAVRDGMDPELADYEEISLQVQERQVQEKEPGEATLEKAPYDYIYNLFRQYKAKSKKLDFADILRFAVNGMADGSIPPLPCTHMLVDEAQDMDPLQYAWIKAHSRPGASGGAYITLVGDDDQSIYGWRYAQGYGGMMRFMTDHSAGHVILPVNYRCAPEILTPSERLIRHNANRVEKPIRAAQPPGGTITFERVGDPEAEADAIENRWHQLGEDETIAYIGRSNRALDALEGELMERDVPYYRAGGGNFLDDPDVAAVHRALTVVNQIAEGRGDPLPHLRQILIWAGFPYRVANDAIQGGGSDVLAIVDALPDIQWDPGHEMQRQFAIKLSRNMPAWVKQAGIGNADRIVAFVARIFSGFAHDKNQGPKQMGRLARAIRTMMKKESPKQDMKIGKCLRNLERNLKKRPEEQARITLLTAHASKGQEFDHVWVTRAEQGQFPTEKATDFDEERRLMYVAMTRAKKTLTLTSRTGKTPSIFLMEAGLTDG